MRDIDELRREMNDLRAIKDFWTAPGAGLFGAAAALAALLALAGAGLLAWRLIEWVFFPLVAAAGAMFLILFLAASLAVGIVRFVLR